MQTALLILGVVLALIWLDRVRDAVSGRKLVPDIAAEPPLPDSACPRIAVIVPARNEAAQLPRAMASLLALDYPQLEIIAVNDRSTDETGTILDEFAARSSRLRVIHVNALPEGWLGKTHAMWLAAQQTDADWLLFTDADIVFRPDTLRRVMSNVSRTRADHFVLLPQLETHTLGERALFSFFQLLFVFGHRPWKVSDPKTRDSIGIGAFNLIRRSTYQELGTYSALRLAVLDDMMLGEVVKRRGYNQRCGLGQELISLKWASGTSQVISNFDKNFFSTMQYRIGRTLGAVFLLSILNLAPFLGLWFASGWAKLPYVLALLAMAALYFGVSRSLRISWAYFYLHPISTLVMIYTLIRSMILAFRHGGVVWRGTVYPLKELREQQEETLRNFTPVGPARTADEKATQ